VSDLPLLQSLGYIIVAAAVVVFVTRPLKIPTIVVYIAVGLLLGPVTQLLAVTETIDVISEVGIVLLLFLVGLELSLDKIRDVGKIAIIAGVVQMALTAGGGFGLALLLGFTTVQALFLAIALTFSSTVVVVKLLEQQGDLHALYGRIAVGILLVQDLAVIVVLTFLAGLGDPQALTLSSITRGLSGAFLGMGVLMVAALIAAKYLLPRAFGWVAQYADALFIWSLCWCFLLVLASELMHLSPEIGAFLAGVSLAQLPFSHNLRRRVHPLMNFFLAIFFVSLGIQMELGAAATYWKEALLLSAAVLVGKPLLFLWLLPRGGYGERTSFLAGVTLAQISEFSFISTALGLSIGLIDESILSVVGLVGLTTMAISSYLILYNEPLYGRVAASGALAIFGAPPQEPAEEGEELSGHVIIVGMNALGRLLVPELMKRGETVLAIDTDERKLATLPCQTLAGNAEHPSLLEVAQLEHAKLLVSTLQIEETNKILAYHCRQVGIPSSIHAFDRSVVQELREIGVSHLMMSKNDGIKRIASELRKAGILQG
jgi:Kef-type K+ transport system membrane component KefB